MLVQIMLLMFPSYKTVLDMLKYQELPFLAVEALQQPQLQQFLVEAIVLCLAGGVVGIILGRAASLAITVLLHWPTIASLPAIVAAVAVSATVGMVFGYYPAWKASRLDPIEALRYE